MPHDETTWIAPMTVTDPVIGSSADADSGSASISGLLPPSELMPLTQTLIPPDLAAVFKISSGPPINAVDVRIASERTLANLQKRDKLPSSPSEPDGDGSRIPHQSISIALGNGNQNTAPLLPDKNTIKELAESGFLPSGNDLADSSLLSNGKDLTESSFLPNGKDLTESSFLPNEKDFNLSPNGKNLRESSFLSNGLGRKNLTGSRFLMNGSGPKDLTEPKFLSNGKDLTESSLLSNEAAGRGLKLEADLWSPLDQHQKTPSASYDEVAMASAGTPFLSLDKRPENGYGLSMSGAAESSEGGSGKKLRKRLEIELEDADSGAGLDNSNEEPTARTLKRPRLVWTPQLHKRFVDAVAHLGIKNAVPKTIMQMMNVDGLTRENVASHLQKYRLYLKRNQGLSTEGPSVSDQLFASTPVPPNIAASTHFLSGNGEDMIPLIMPMPMVGISPNHHMPGNLGVSAPFRGFDHNMYNGFVRSSSMQQRYPSMDGEFLLNSQAKPMSSPQQPILTLFPSGGT